MGRTRTTRYIILDRLFRIVLSRPAWFSYGLPRIRMFLARGPVQTIKDLFGVPQIRRVKAFRKLGADRLQHLQRFVCPAFA